MNNFQRNYSLINYSTTLQLSVYALKFSWRSHDPFTNHNAVTTHTQYVHARLWLLAWTRARTCPSWSVGASKGSPHHQHSSDWTCTSSVAWTASHLVLAPVEVCRWHFDICLNPAGCSFAACTPPKHRSLLENEESTQL